MEVYIKTLEKCFVFVLVFLIASEGISLIVCLYIHVYVCLYVKLYINHERYSGLIQKDQEELSHRRLLLVTGTHL